MNRTFLALSLFSAFMLTAAPKLNAQARPTGPSSHRTDNSRPVSHRGNDRDAEAENEYLMSHLEGVAGDVIGLVLPQRVIDSPHKDGRWQAVESEKIRIMESNSTSAVVRLLESGTTVVNFKYVYMVGDRQESASYPFTIRIFRVEPESIMLPTTLRLGWDVDLNLANQVKLQPAYAETSLTYELEDPEIAEITEGYSGLRITGRSLGQTVLHVETSNGLHAEARVIVQVPELSSISISKGESRRFTVGDQMPLKLTLNPARAEARITWSSDKPEIVSVDQNGVVTAHAEGKATIRAVADNGKKDDITIKVKKE